MSIAGQSLHVMPCLVKNLKMCFIDTAIYACVIDTNQQDEILIILISLSDLQQDCIHSISKKKKKKKKKKKNHVVFYLQHRFSNEKILICQSGMKTHWHGILVSICSIMLEMTPAKKSSRAPDSGHDNTKRVNR